MQLHVRNMTEDYAKQILNWKYEAPYDFYNNEETSESLNELLENPYYAVLNQDDKLIGFFCIGIAAQVPFGATVGAYNEDMKDMKDIGIGMKPAITGQGFGTQFFKFILSYIQETYHLDSIRLTVAKFNQRAIHLYTKLGFNKKVEFSRGTTEFITMVKID
ncbi:GNAT family protein [Neobacillus sp. DY30]|uniref:GNAT family N-acetyltransferase n=1 Tax=Neobacillus sp. DY30 TaxID=3047871 RepID=UPI0024BF2824|nr:GNAT family protein [Neobacillus sp. DY30]WHY00075.1 GNAT family protein [Neobacillus sp. DY30]